MSGALCSNQITGGRKIKSQRHTPSLEQYTRNTQMCILLPITGRLFVVSPSSGMSSIESSFRRLLAIQQNRFCGSRHTATIIYSLPAYALPISLRDQEKECMHKCEMVDFLLVVRPSRHQSITAAQCSSRPGPSPLACAVVMNNN